MLCVVLPCWLVVMYAVARLSCRMFALAFCLRRASAVGCDMCRWSDVCNVCSGFPDLPLLCYAHFAPVVFSLFSCKRLICLRGCRFLRVPLVFRAVRVLVFRDVTPRFSILRCARLVCFRCALVTCLSLFSSRAGAMQILAVICAIGHFVGWNVSYIFSSHLLSIPGLLRLPCAPSRGFAHAASCAVIGYFWFASCHIL